MTKEKLKNCYRSLKDAAMSDWHLGDALIQLGYNLFRLGGEIKHPAY
ncbi:MAG: hypothetical protein J6V23_03525 [Bacteroidaceae bacterium]|nr:hypothetical protein [Bacteroidaceae bacterium]